MSSLAPTTYFVSGANRGIGLGLVTALTQRDNILVFAGARNPSKADALNTLAKETGRVVVVKLESTSGEDAKAAAELVKKKVGKLDYLIANAGISSIEGVLPAIATTRALVEEHHQVNTIGPLLLVQALAPLLVAAPAPHFVAISTTVGSISMAQPIPLTAYGMSKAALNYFVRKVALEHGEKDGLAAYAISPGFVQTDLGNAGAKMFGMEEAPFTLKESVESTLRIMDGATREKSGGRFWDYTGEELTW
ncbi:hypothetical protein JCM10450v2_007631 [Rhodotorula kratochvilovae]